MKKFLIALAFLAVASLQTEAQAAFVIGNQAFVSTATVTVPPGGTIASTKFTMAFATLGGGTNQTGDFAVIPEVASFTNTLDTTLPLAFVFGNAAFGFFTPAVVLNNSLIPGTSLTYAVSGSWVPGTDFAWKPGTVTPAKLTITINQTGAALSASATFATAAPSVPEPATIVMLGTFCVPVAFGWMRRRRLSK